jgi:hypothetical protein
VTIEQAIVKAKRKPWGSTDLLPWTDTPAYLGPHVNSGALQQRRQTAPGHSRPEIQEVETWSL